MSCGCLPAASFFQLFQRADLCQVLLNLALLACSDLVQVVSSSIVRRSNLVEWILWALVKLLADALLSLL